jgi:hypothetical protein
MGSGNLEPVPQFGRIRSVAQILEIADQKILVLFLGIPTTGI